jgi:undecaprenyl-phosphate 4-deoxy-4-formamido-L-arabinose transferase
VSVVVPVYNGGAALPALVARLGPVLDGPAGGGEILLVNDGSRDDSWAVIERLAAADPRVRGIDLMRNYGQHSALVCGIRAARGEVVVTMDDDLQHPPEEIPRLLDRLGPDADLVYGTPRTEEHAPGRRLAGRLTKLALERVLGVETARMVGAFRAFRTPLRDAFAAYQGPGPNVDVMLGWATTRVAAVPVRHEPRAHGRSHYSTAALVVHALTMLTGFSAWPLRVASLVGFASTLFGVGVLAWVLGRYLVRGSPVPGFPFLASVIAIFAGAQLFALGTIGEYLARMHFRLMDRPTYAVRATTEP